MALGPERPRHHYRFRHHYPPKSRLTPAPEHIQPLSPHVSQMLVFLSPTTILPNSVELLHGRWTSLFLLAHDLAVTSRLERSSFVDEGSLLWEAVSGMEDCQNNNSDEDHSIAD